MKARSVIVMAAVLTAGCGSTETVTQSQAPATSTPAATSQASAAHEATMTRAEAARAYLAAIAPPNAALRQLDATARTWTDVTTSDQAAADAAPAVSALNDLRPKLLALAEKYPPARDDLRSLVTMFAGLQGDLVSLRGVNNFNGADWLRQLVTDATKERTAADIVRADLGLPPS